MNQWRTRSQYCAKGGAWIQARGGQGDFRMAASSGIVFAEALLGRDGRVSAQPGAWYPEEVLSLNRVEASLRRAGIDVTKTDHDRVGSASVR